MDKNELERRLGDALLDGAGSGAASARFVACEVRDENGERVLLRPADAAVTIRLEFELDQPARLAPALGLSLEDGRGLSFWAVHDAAPAKALDAGRHTAEMTIPGCFLAVGPYKVSGALLSLEGEPALAAGPETLVSFYVVEESDPEGSARGPHIDHATGLMRPRLNWSVGDLEEAQGGERKPAPGLDDIAEEGVAELVSATVADEHGEPVTTLSRGDRATIELVWRLDQPCIFAPTFAVVDYRGVVVFRSIRREHQIESFICPAGHRYGVVWLPLDRLRAGQYSIEAAASDPRTRPLRRYFRDAMVARFTLVADGEAGGAQLGAVRAPVSWTPIVKA